METGVVLITLEQNLEIQNLFSLYGQYGVYVHVQVGVFRLLSPQGNARGGKWTRRGQTPTRLPDGPSFRPPSTQIHCATTEVVGRRWTDGRTSGVGGRVTGTTGRRGKTLDVRCRFMETS